MNNQEPNAVIVCGPQGCGKTTHAKAIAAHFGLTSIIDDWMATDTIHPGTLYLTTDTLEDMVRAKAKRGPYEKRAPAEVVSFKTIACELGLFVHSNPNPATTGAA